jgi:hypothetical protein
MRCSASIFVTTWVVLVGGCSGKSAPTASNSPVKPATSAIATAPSSSQASAPVMTSTAMTLPETPSPSIEPVKSKLAPVPTVAPNAKLPSKAFAKGVTCSEDGGRCSPDKPICVIRNFARCFTEEEIRKDMPLVKELPPISKDACYRGEVCPNDRPYCIWDSITGCVDEPTATQMIDEEPPSPQTYGVYNQCTIAKDCPWGKTCCRGGMGHGYSSCQPRCDLVNTQIQCSTEADCKPLRDYCSDQACRDRVHCNESIMGFVKVCEETQ